MTEATSSTANANANVIVRKSELLSGLSAPAPFLISMKSPNEGMSCWFSLWYGFYILNGVMSQVVVILVSSSVVKYIWMMLTALSVCFGAVEITKFSVASQTHVQVCHYPF